MRWRRSSTARRARRPARKTSISPVRACVLSSHEYPQEVHLTLSFSAMSAQFVDFGDTSSVFNSTMMSAAGEQSILSQRSVSYSVSRVSRPVLVDSNRPHVLSTVKVSRYRAL